MGQSALERDFVGLQDRRPDPERGVRERGGGGKPLLTLLVEMMQADGLDYGRWRPQVRTAGADCCRTLQLGMAPKSTQQLQRVLGTSTLEGFFQEI